MTHELKFRYVYGIPDRPESYFFRYFSMDDIEEGAASDVFVGSVLISRDMFTGLKDKNGKEIYENDLVRGKDKEGEILNHIVKYKFGGFEPFTCYINECRVDEINCVIIGNTHGVKP